MILPTSEEILAAKADAMARFGRDEVLQVELVAPIDLCVLVAPFTFRAWCTLTDEQARDVETSKAAAVSKQRLWPDAAAVGARFARRPAAAGKVLGRLITRAGQTTAAPTVELLADVVRRAAKDAEVIPGLSAVKAQELLAEHPDDELWAVAGVPGLSLVLATPDADVYLAAKAAHARAVAKCERITETKLDFARPLIRWISTPIDALLEDRPGLAQDIKVAFDLVAGEGAEASSKSL